MHNNIQLLHLLSCITDIVIFQVSMQGFAVVDLRRREQVVCIEGLLTQSRKIKEDVHLTAESKVLLDEAKWLPQTIRQAVVWALKTLSRSLL